MEHLVLVQVGHAAGDVRRKREPGGRAPINQMTCSRPLKGPLSLLLIDPPPSTAQPCGKGNLTSTRSGSLVPQAEPDWTALVQSAAA